MNSIALATGTLEIIQDENAESPREWDNLGTMVCFHKRYNLGDKHDYKDTDFNGWDELRAQIEKDHDPALILPLYLFDHSGITISCSCEHFRAQDSMGWDWGQVGFIFVSKEKARTEFGRLTKKRLERIQRCLVGEVETYDQYLRGDVYGFVLKRNDGEEDSCWGFYGDNPLENGMSDHLSDEDCKVLVRTLT